MTQQDRYSVLQSGLPKKTTDRIKARVSNTHKKKKNQWRNPKHTKDTSSSRHTCGLADGSEDGMMLLANTDEWKNQSDSHTHLIWYSHVTAERQTESLLTETWLMWVPLLYVRESSEDLWCIIYGYLQDVALAWPLNFMAPVKNSLWFFKTMWLNGD